MGRHTGKFVAHINSKLNRANQRLCKRVKDIRTTNGLTQDEMAAKCKVNGGTIKQIEIGMHAPSIDLLRTIHKKFNISYEYLIDGD